MKTMPVIAWPSLSSGAFTGWSAAQPNRIAAQGSGLPGALPTA
ncbi:MAG TPA: hypothetical protein VHO07_18340 [Streptosporangiaceae bacterium]|jgi:hypothetical protein|nr:hypothetical protein [Streptosporangiaceae bacterium]